MLILPTFFWAAVLVGSEILFVNSKQVAVVQFKEYWHDQNVTVDYSKSEELVKTDQVGICFRFMVKFSRKFRFRIKQFGIDLYNSKEFLGYVYFRPLNETLRPTWRFFTTCDSYIPGEWVSMCFTAKLTKNEQELTFYQNGKLCMNKQFVIRKSDVPVEWLYIKKTLSLSQL